MEEVVYDSPRTSLARKLAVAVGTGAAFFAVTRFAAWGFHPAALARGTPWVGLLVGVGVAAVMVAAALRSRVARVVSIDHVGRKVRVHRDPGAVDDLPFDTIDRVASEPLAGGWSRDPSERLVVTMKDGTVRRYTLPDDADTPGIVKDLDAARRSVRK